MTVLWREAWLYGEDKAYAGGSGDGDSHWVTWGKTPSLWGPFHHVQSRDLTGQCLCGR